MCGCVQFEIFIMIGKILESIVEYYNYSIKPFHEVCVGVCNLKNIPFIMKNIFKYHLALELVY